MISIVSLFDNCGNFQYIVNMEELFNNKSAKIQQLRNTNIEKICHQLFKKTMSGAELAVATDISTASASKILRQMSELALVSKRNDDGIARAIGRQHERYELNAGKAHVICLNLTYLNEFFLVFDFAGNEVYHESLALPYELTRSEIDALFHRIKGVIAEKSYNVGFFVFSVPGQVHSETGELFLSSSRLKTMLGTNFKSIIQEQFFCDALVANDVNFMVQGRNGFDAIGRYSVYCYVGYGMAISMFCDGKILSGINGYSGEIGKNVIDGELLKTKCGARYYLEEARKIVPDADYNDIKTLYAGNEEFRAIVLNSAKFLAQSLCNFCNILAFDRLIFSGIICDFDDAFFEVIEKYFAEHSSVSVRIGKGKNEDVQKGMFMLGFEAMLKGILASR